MNILVALNSGYLNPLCIMLRSLVDTNPETAIDLYILHTDLSANNLLQIQNAAGNSVSLHPVQIQPDFLADAPIMKRTSKETYYRLYAMDFLPPEVDRILYLDPDIIINGPLDSLYNLDFGNALFAGCAHLQNNYIEKINRFRLNMPKYARYINAGVLLMNLRKLRNCITTDMITKFIRMNYRKLYLADQDVLNALFSGRIRCLDERIYNLDEKTLAYHAETINTDWVWENSLIIHFNGKEKPWKDQYKGRLRPFYLQYAGNSVLEKKVPRSKSSKSLRSAEF